MPRWIIFTVRVLICGFNFHHNYAVLCAVFPVTVHLQPVAAVSLNNVAVLRSRQTELSSQSRRRWICAD